MFLRIDTDLFINVNNIGGYKLFDEGDSYKLIIWGTEGKIAHSVYYMKHQPTQIALLQEVVNNFRELTINPDLSMYREIGEIHGEGDTLDEGGMIAPEEPPRRIKESIPGQMTIDDILDEDPIIEEEDVI